MTLLYDKLSVQSFLVAYGTWFVIATFYAYQYVQRIVPNIVMEQMSARFSLDANSIGVFAGCFYLGYILMHIPLAVILDHFNSKIVIPVCILVAALGFSPMLVFDNFTASIVGRIFIGAGATGAALGGFKLLRIAFGEAKFPKMFGLMATIGLLTASFGSGPVMLFISETGWNFSMSAIIIFGIALAFLSYIILPNTKSDTKFSLKSLAKDFKYLFSKPIIFIISILGGLMIGPLEGFADAWSNSYLKNVYNLSNEEANSATTLIHSGMAIGVIVLGYIFEKSKSYYGILIYSGIAMLFAFMLVLYDILPSDLIIHRASLYKIFGSFIVKKIFFIKLLFFIIGFFCAYQILVIAKAMSLVSLSHSTFTSAIVNMIMMSFGFIFHSAIGKIMIYTNHNIDLPGQSFQYALMIIPIGLIIGVLGFFILSLIDKKK